MTIHLCAFYKNVITNGSLVQLDAVSDQALTLNGSNIIVPDKVNMLLAEAGLSASTTPDFAQMQAPSLRDLTYQDVDPVVNGVVFGSNPAVQHHFENPRPLVSSEELSAYLQANDATAADNYVLAWLGDAATKPTTGEMFSVRATSAITLSNGAWVSGALTFEETLPYGNYDVVGMRAEGTNLIAARLNFTGGIYRPGVPAVNNSGNREWLYGRNGALGVLGSFAQNLPPKVDCFGVTDTSQAYVLDLIKTK